MKKHYIPVIAGALLLLTSSCTSTKPLYYWGNYDDAIYVYTKNNDPKSLEKLMEEYEDILQKTEKGSRNTPPPGVCADLGYLLIKEGKIKEGKELLAKETALYPESKKFIDGVLKRMEK